MSETMNIRAQKGDKVMVTHNTANNGMTCDKIKVKKHLVVNTEYTVDHTEVHGWCTDVYLEEVPNIPFNSINFIDLPKTKPSPRFTYSKNHNTYTLNGCRDAALEVIKHFEKMLCGSYEIDEIDIEHLFRHIEKYNYYRENPDEEEID